MSLEKRRIVPGTKNNIPYPSTQLSYCSLILVLNTYNQNVAGRIIRYSILIH